MGNTLFIYAIRNITTGKIYIGVSNNPKSRISSHFGQLKSGKHPITSFQDDFELYGVDDFECFILEEFERSDDKESPKEKTEVNGCYPNKDHIREYEWMRKYRTTEEEYGYNTSDRIAKRYINGERLIDIKPGLPPLPKE